MKRLQVILLTFVFCLTAFIALGQRGNSSDWIVPPPTPVGTIPKSPNGKLKPAIPQTPIDVPAPDLKTSLDAKAAALSSVTEVAPDVVAPDQPEFPGSPVQTPAIPLPAVPQAIALPKQTLHEQPDENHMDMPEPQSPEMPELPLPPTIKPGAATGGSDLKVPVIPSIITQPTAMVLPSNGFSFTEWPAPAIPENNDVSLSSTIEDNSNKIKNDVKKKPPGRRRDR